MNKRNIKINRRSLILWLVLLAPYIIGIFLLLAYWNKYQNIQNASFVVIDKNTMTLYHYNYKGELLQKSGIACGKNAGNKTSIGDLKTPEGVFSVSQIEDASSWAHDFKDDTLGKIEGAYGPYFIRLNVPGQKGIGIHGTHDENSIGTKATEGCIRLSNQDITKLAQHIEAGSVVVITPGIKDVMADTLAKLHNGTTTNQTEHSIPGKQKTQSVASEDTEHNKKSSVIYRTNDHATKNLSVKVLEIKKSDSLIVSKTLKNGKHTRVSVQKQDSTKHVITPKHAIGAEKVTSAAKNTGKPKAVLQKTDVSRTKKAKIKK